LVSYFHFTLLLHVIVQFYRDPSLVAFLFART
jgi:hypothetical protein